MTKTLEIKSNQRAYQARQLAAGKCYKCSEEEYRSGLCERHYEMQLEYCRNWRKRNPNYKKKWDAKRKAEAEVAKKKKRKAKKQRA